MVGGPVVRPGAAAADQALLLPFGLALALAGGLPLIGLGFRRLLRPAPASGGVAGAVLG